jgi:hypothetical protein
MYSPGDVHPFTTVEEVADYRNHELENCANDIYLYTDVETGEV